MNIELPHSLKRAVRHAVLDPVQRRLSEWRLQQSIAGFRAGSAHDNVGIAKFRRAWGNESYSADAAYVAEVASRVSRCTGPVLECGSGLTTFVAALAGERKGLTVWSLEQDLEWFDFVSRKLLRHKVRNVVLKYAPLKDYGGYVWYDINGLDLPDNFSLALCDGPAVFEAWGDAHTQWRYGLLPVLAARGVGVQEVLLDDATEPRAANLLQMWKLEFGMEHRMLQTADGDCAIVAKVVP